MKTYSILLITFCFYGAVWSQKTPKYVYGMLPVDGIGYVGQSEVNVFDWLNYMESAYLDKSENEEIMSVYHFLPDLEKVHPSYRFIFPLIERMFIMRMFSDYEYDDGKTEEIYDLNPHSFDKDTCIYEVKRSGYKFFLGEWEYEHVQPKIAMAINMPMTGLYFEQVTGYIAFYENYVNDSKAVQKSDYTLKVQLPTPDQWQAIAAQNLVLIPEHREIGQTYPDSMNTEGPCPLYNYLTWSTPCHSDSSMAEIYGYFNGPVEVYSYNPSIDGLYCLFGNVAEMTSEFGIAMGGYYMQYAVDCFPDKIQTYSDPEEWLGFRLIGILEEK